MLSERTARRGHQTRPPNSHLPNNPLLSFFFWAASQEKKRTPVRTDRVRPGFTNAEVDQWIEEDKALPENQPYVSGKFVTGDKVQLQETGMEFVVHEFTHQGIVLKHEGGAFKNGAKDDDLVRAGTWVEKAVHHGVGCDRSGMAPIIGTRYNKGEEDLCEAEYNKMTDEEKVGWTAIPFPPEKGKQQNGHENGSTEKHENGNGGGFFGW